MYRFDPGASYASLAQGNAAGFYPADSRFKSEARHALLVQRTAQPPSKRHIEVRFLGGVRDCGAEDSTRAS
jgi:hypothetical protein